MRRRRQATSNKILTCLKAVLNHAVREGCIASDAAWRSIAPFPGTAAQRERYLSLAECERLLNSCDPDFRSLVAGALETGARYGELIKLKVVDFNPDSGTLRIETGKARGKIRHVVLTEDGQAFLADLCTGRPGAQVLFLRENGEAWRKNDQIRPMQVAVERAKISPPISFHGLRHTAASHLVMGGVPLVVVAQNLGHADTRMTERYKHLAPDYAAAAIRKGAPKFGTVRASTVKPIR
jgi:integrase